MLVNRPKQMKVGAGIRKAFEMQKEATALARKAESNAQTMRLDALRFAALDSLDLTHAEFTEETDKAIAECYPDQKATAQRKSCTVLIHTVAPLFDECREKAAKYNLRGGKDQASAVENFYTFCRIVRDLALELQKTTDLSGIVKDEPKDKYDRARLTFVHAIEWSEIEALCEERQKEATKKRKAKKREPSFTRDQIMDGARTYVANGGKGDIKEFGRILEIALTHAGKAKK